MLIGSCLTILNGIISPKANDLSSGEFLQKIGKNSQKTPDFAIFRKIQNFRIFYISLYGIFDSAIGTKSVLKLSESRLQTFSGSPYSFRPFWGPWNVPTKRQHFVSFLVFWSTNVVFTQHNASRSQMGSVAGKRVHFRCILHLRTIS